MQRSPSKSDFLWVGNWLALDLVNTEIVVEGRRVDLLPDAASYAAWLAEARVADAGKTRFSSQQRERMVRAARRYRAVLRKSASAIADGRGAPQDLLAQTNAILLRPENVMCLAEQGGTYRLAPDPHPKSAEAFLAPVARSMVKLLVEADLSRVRKCKNPDCVLYFYDTTKSGTRSWCSLDICGNKLRMAASRERCNRD